MRASLAVTTILITALGGVVASPAHAEENRLAALAQAEVVDLHRFLDDWSNARLENTDAAYERFATALAPDFALIGTDGTTSRRDAIVSALRGAHGRWLRDGLRGGRIEIRNVSVRAIADPIAVVSYEEWHLLDGSEPQGRASTAVLRRDTGAPGGVVWVHLHETWLR